MAIDASIYSQIQAPKENNLLAQYGQMQAIQSAQNQNRLAELMYGDKQREVESANAMDAAYKGAIGADGVIDRTKLYTSIAQTAGSKLPAIQKGFSETDKAAREADKAQLEQHLKRFEIAGQIFNGVKDQPSYDRAKQDTARILGADVAAKMPPVYDPELIAENQARAMDQKTRLEQIWKAKEYSTPKADAVLSATTSTANNAATNERSRLNNAATVGASYASQAQSAAQHASTMGKPFEVTGQDGTPVLVRQDRQGNISRVEGFGPKVGAEKPLTEVQGTATNFAARMRSASSILDPLEVKGVSTADPSTMLAGSAWTNFLASPDGRQYQQAEQNWVTANLRKESGAVIGDSEMARERRKYFPIPSDDKATREQKQQARKIAEEGMVVQAGPGAKTIEATLNKVGNAPKVPQIGSVQDGYQFKGGKPSDPNSWEKI